MNEGTLQDCVNKQLLEFATGRQMFCGNPTCRTVLDVNHAVQVEYTVSGGRSFCGVFCGDCYERDREHNARLAQMRGIKIEVLDGRVLFPAKRRRRRKR